jgi:hypothetical protein
MMLAVGLFAAVVAQSGEGASGRVKVTRGPVGQPAWVSLATDSGTLRLTGHLTTELAKLASARIEVIGIRDRDDFVVKAYTILEVSGVKPIVGYLLRTTHGFALKDGDRAALPLSLPPRSRQRLSDKAGAKLWVYGKTLVSGELKVSKYGILRLPPTARIPTED